MRRLSAIPAHPGSSWAVAACRTGLFRMNLGESSAQIPSCSPRSQEGARTVQITGFQRAAGGGERGGAAARCLLRAKGSQGQAGGCGSPLAAGRW